MLEKNKKSTYTLKNAEHERTKPILDLSRTVMAEHFVSKTRPWDIINRLSAHIKERGIELPFDSYDEIAETLDLEVGTVKSRIFRARKKLCAFLIKDGNIPDYVSSSKTRGGDLS